jgi:beta-lactamase regulating signal transducer with metallopeptidase domain
MRALGQVLSEFAPLLLKGIAWPMLWQSSLLIGLLFLVDFIFGRRLRPVVRYALWLLVLLKLTLPPTLALPTSLAWWIRPSTHKPDPRLTTAVVVRYRDSSSLPGSTESAPAKAPLVRSVLTPQAWLVLCSGIGSAALFVWMVRRWREVAVAMRCVAPVPIELERLLDTARETLSFKRSVRLRLSDKTISPVVFGFLRPVILLPETLARHLTEAQLRGVLLHELIHLRRGDVWFNCAQTMLQIVYWWHPLLWLANARIRRIREEAVDDAVMCALRDDAIEYPQTLLEVAKFALGRPLSGLALVGILESRHALRQRIERLVDFRFPRRAGLTLGSVLSLIAFGALALPMGQAPIRMAQAPSIPGPASENWPDPRFQGYAEVSLNARFLIVDRSLLELFLPAVAGAQSPLVLTSNDLAEVERKLNQADAQFFPKMEALTLAYFSGGRFHYRVGDVIGNSVDYQTQTNSKGFSVVVGAECSYYVGPRPDWVPLDFTFVPWLYRGATLCQIRLGLANDVGSALEGEVTIPTGGAMVWIAPGLRSGKSELVFLKEGKPNQDNQVKTNEAPTRSSTKQDEQVVNLVRDARLLFEIGKFDEAEKLLHEAQALDRRSPSASYYLDLISKARAEQRPPVRLLHPGGTNLVLASNAPQTIYSELQRIRLKEISFDHLPLAEVLRRLNDEVSPDFTFRLKATTAGGSSSEANPHGAAGATADISQTPITILPSLVDVRLSDVIDAVVRVATQRIKYTIERDAVEFSGYSSTSKPLYTRLIRVDLINIHNRLAEAVGETNLTDPGAALSALRRLLISKGVNLQPPETLFLNDRDGTLLVHTTLEKLSTVEKTIGELNTPQLQLNIKTRFLHVPDSAVHELWQAIGPIRADSTNFSKILTPSQTAVVLKAINVKHRDYLINEASVTTLSGRQCEVECVDLRTILSNNVPAKIPFGPAIDLIPVLMPDTWKVNLRTVASLREFLGYDDTSPFLPQFEDPKDYPQPQGPGPHIRVRQLTSNSTVPDGYTLVLCNPVDMKGELAEKPGASEQHYLVLVTPTVLSPTGTRLHTDARLRSS